MSSRSEGEAATIPLGIKPVCSKCRVKNSMYWKRTDSGEIQCITCFSGKGTRQATPPDPEKPLVVPKQEVMPSTSKASGSTGRGGARRGRGGRHGSTRARGGGSKNFKGKGRRSLMKKTPAKAPQSMSTPVVSEYIIYKGSYFQTGDIVSVIDVDGGIYYAQIRAFLQDQHCEKSAVITWLLPTDASNKRREIFDPSTYILGPEEELPRLMKYFEFVMHAPSDYFKDRSSPYPVSSIMPRSGFIWTRMGPKIVDLSSESTDK